jgi:glutamate mutase epsilon subunit
VVLYIPVQVLFGYLNCADNFCPGDREQDYVYTVKDEDGNTWYIEDGKPLLEKDYKEAHKNVFEFKERNDNEPRR